MRRAVGLALLSLFALAACESAPPRAEEPAPTPEDPPADALEASLRERGEELAAWMMRNGPAMRGELAEGGVRDFSHLMQPGWCYKILGLGGEGIEDLDLRLYDGGNALVQRDSTQDPRPHIGRERAVCPSEAATYRIEVRARRGSGPFAVQVYRSL
jgi:hypothetical protein